MIPARHQDFVNMLFSDDHAARMLHDDPEGYRRRLDEYLAFGRVHVGKRFARNGAREYPVSPLLNTVVCGDCRDVLDRLPERSVDLVFTSPPYFNARPELGCFEDYEEYLVFLKSVIEKVGRVLVPSRFFVLNLAPVIVPRERRSDESKRLALPFDSHRLFVENGYEFIDDIIWVKPEGAGWVSGRGRRFGADRNALAYKPAPVTEYVLVYRKQSDRLIDWFLRNHPDRALVERSKIVGDYEVTNVWQIPPAHSKVHPAVFPVVLAERVIRYYSFENDVVLDPFAGIGTVGTAALDLGRRFYLIERGRKYIDRFLEVERARFENTWLTGMSRGQDRPVGKTPGLVG